jgi:hypothetical protein
VPAVRYNGLRLAIFALLFGVGCGRTSPLTASSDAPTGPSGPASGADAGVAVDGGSVARDGGVSTGPRDGGVSTDPRDAFVAADLTSGGSDGGEPIGNPVIDCVSDSLPGGVIAGTAALPSYAVDFVPLCDGWLALADDDHDQLAFFNPILGQHADGLPLAASPRALAFDSARDLIYAAFSPATGIAKIELSSGAVIAIDGPAANHLAIGNGGQVLGVLPTYPNDVVTMLQVFDGDAGTFLTSLELPKSDGIGSQMVYDRSHDYIVTVDINLNRYVFDPASLTVTLAQSVYSNYDEDPNALAISADGSRIAPAWGGVYHINDTNTDDLANVVGVWNPGAYPVGAAYSGDGRYFATTNGEKLMVFDAVTFALVTSVAPSSSFRCNGTAPSGNDWRVGFSRGGRVAYMLAPSCIFQTTGGFVVYTIVP